MLFLSALKNRTRLKFENGIGIGCVGLRESEKNGEWGQNTRFWKYGLSRSAVAIVLSLEERADW